MASREELLQSIRPKMKLNKAFFLKIYGYEISFPGFARQAIKSLNDAGCSKAEQYYDKIVSEYEKEREAVLKEVAAWYKKKCEAEWQKRIRSQKIQKKRKKKEQWVELSQILNFH